jgi:hypothetical protein
VRDRGEEDVSGTAIGTELSAWIIDLFSGEAAAFGCAILSDPPLTPAPHFRDNAGRLDRRRIILSRCDLRR